MSCLNLKEHVWSVNSFSGFFGCHVAFLQACRLKETEAYSATSLGMKGWLI